MNKVSTNCGLIQKSRYLENKTLFFLQIKKDNLLHIKGYFTAKNSFAVEVTFKEYFKVKLEKSKAY